MTACKALIRKQPAVAANWPGEAVMTGLEVHNLDEATLGDANADVFYQLGILYSAGGEIPADYVAAHKWFNIAALRGNGEAVRMRREVAELMSEGEIASAQRAARDWLKPRASLQAA